MDDGVNTAVVELLRGELTVSPTPGRLVVAGGIEVRWSSTSIEIDGHAPDVLTAADPIVLRVSRGRHAARRGDDDVLCVELLGRGQRLLRLWATCDEPQRIEGLPWGEATGAQVALEPLVELVTAARALDAEVAHWSAAQADGEPPRSVARSAGWPVHIAALLGGRWGVILALVLAATSLIVVDSAWPDELPAFERRFTTEATITDVSRTTRRVYYTFAYRVPEGIEPDWEREVDEFLRRLGPDKPREVAVWTYHGNDPGHREGDRVPIEFGRDDETWHWRARIVGMEEARRAPIPDDEVWVWLAVLLIALALAAWRWRGVSLLRRGQLATATAVPGRRLYRFRDHRGQLHDIDSPARLERRIGALPETVTVVYWPDQPARARLLLAFPGRPTLETPPGPDTAARLVGDGPAAWLQAGLWSVAVAVACVALVYIVARGIDGAPG